MDAGPTRATVAAVAVGLSCRAGLAPRRYPVRWTAGPVTGLAGMLARSAGSGTGRVESAGVRGQVRREVGHVRPDAPAVEPGRCLRGPRP